MQRSRTDTDSKPPCYRQQWNIIFTTPCKWIHVLYRAQPNQLLQLLNMRHIALRGTNGGQREEEAIHESIHPSVNLFILPSVRFHRQPRQP